MQSNAGHQFADAVREFQAGRPDEAELICRALLDQRHADAGLRETGQPQALNLLAVILCQRGEFGNAIPLLRQALEVRPNDLQALRTLGQAFYVLGQFPAAVEAYARACGVNPNDADLYSNLGEALLEAGALDTAEAAFRQAVALRPDVAGYHSALGVLLVEAGRLDEAIAAYHAALACHPGEADLHAGLGAALMKLDAVEEAFAAYATAAALAPEKAAAWLAEAHHASGLARRRDGQADAAIAAFRQALELRPDWVDAHRNLGLALREAGRIDEAVAVFRRAVELDGHNADLLFGLALSLAQDGRDSEAISHYGRALEIDPAFADAAYNCALALRSIGRPEEALASYDRALAIRPDFAEAWANRGVLLHELGRVEEALGSYDAALALKADFAGALNGAANALMNLGRLEDALARFDRALAIKPDLAGAWTNRGAVLEELGRVDDALESCERALAIEPDLAEALNKRASILLGLRRLEEAQATFERVLALQPDSAAAFTGVAYCSLNLCDWDRCGRISESLKRDTRLEALLHPFAALGYFDDPDLQLRTSRNWMQAHVEAGPAPLHIGDRRRHDKIRIAYLSADFRSHAVPNLIAQVFEIHDRSRFEVIGVSFGPDDNSRMRDRIVRALDQFHDVRLAADQEVAERLRELEVDIAIDLMGHTKFARPGILARRAVPIQVNYLGHPGTTGADFVDYIVADPVVAPFEQQQSFSERIVHLPDCYQANDATRAISERALTRAEFGLPERGMVFCCFNNSWKITEPVFAIWMRLLHAVDGSVLWLLGDNPGAEANLRRAAEARGIDPARVVFAGRRQLPDHLARHRLADLFLDTLPYNGHTTTSDALWAGLPVLTCQGRAFAGRVASSLLQAIGLAELITPTFEAYEALALALARDPARLALLRAKLARNRDSYPLFDTQRFCSHLETAYRTMWEIWQRGEPPRSFAVEALPSAR